MDLSPFGLRASAGALRACAGVVFDHAWSVEGVLVTPVANGAQVLHLSVALCVLNDTYREAARLVIGVDGFAVEAEGGFDQAWCSTGIEYVVTVDTRASTREVTRLSAVVDEVTEIPRTIRAGAPATRRR